MSQMSFDQILQAIQGIPDPVARVQSLAGTNIEGKIPPSFASLANQSFRAQQAPLMQLLQGQLAAQRQQEGNATRLALQSAQLTDKQQERQAKIELAIQQGDRKTALEEIKLLRAESMLQKKLDAGLQEIQIKGDLDVTKLKEKATARMDELAYRALTTEQVAQLRFDLDQKKKDAEHKMEMQREAETQAREQQIYKQAKASAINGPADPVVKAAIESLGAGSANGKLLAGELTRMADKAVNMQTARALSMYGSRIRAAGAQVDPKMVAEEVRAGRSALDYIEKAIDTANQNAIAASKSQAHYTKAEAAGQKLGLTGPALEAFLARAGAAVEKTPDMLLKEAEASTVAGRKKMSTYKGIGAAVVMGYLANKWLGSQNEEGQRIDPELQMALLQRMQTGGEDEGKATGRELQNMSRALNIIQLLGRMQGMQAESPVSVGRLM
jgi:hypothetical protein